MPESPRWLVSKGRDDEALQVLSTLRTKERAEAELGEIDDGRRRRSRAARRCRSARSCATSGSSGSSSSASASVSPSSSPASTRSCTTARRVLNEAGFSASAALIVNIAPGIVAVIGAIIALRMMDHFSAPSHLPPRLLADDRLPPAHRPRLGRAARRQPRAAVGAAVPHRGLRRFDADVPQRRDLGDALRDLPAQDARLRHRRLGLLPVDRQRVPRPVLPDGHRGASASPGTFFGVRRRSTCCRCSSSGALFPRPAVAPSRSSKKTCRPAQSTCRTSLVVSSRPGG